MQNQEKTVNDFITTEQRAFAQKYADKGNYWQVEQVEKSAKLALRAWDFALEVSAKIPNSSVFVEFPESDTTFGATVFLLIGENLRYQIKKDEYKIDMFSIFLADTWQFRGYYQNFSPSFDSKSASRTASKLLEYIPKDEALWMKNVEAVNRQKEREDKTAQNVSWVAFVTEQENFYKYVKVAGSNHEIEVSANTFDMKVRNISDAQLLKILDILRENDCNKCHGKMVEGEALQNTLTGLPDFEGDTSPCTVSMNGQAALVKVKKCQDCGYSFTV
jgi:hypothetical protein